jgi:hypothetical protein
MLHASFASAAKKPYVVLFLYRAFDLRLSLRGTADFALPERDFGYSMAGLPRKSHHINNLSAKATD